MSTEKTCWCCDSTLPSNDGNEAVCSNCQRLHFASQVGEKVHWLPRDVGGYILQGATRFTDYGCQCPARDRDGVGLITITVLRVPESLVRAELVEHARPIVGRAHVNVVRMRDVGEDGPLLWVVHDLFDAKDLEKLQENLSGTLHAGLGVRLEILGQVAKGLAFLHACGSMHGRLHPGNVLVAEDGGVRLMYGGLAELAMRGGIQHLTNSLPTQSFEGSPYAPPELTSGSGASPAADCYSYGVNAYRLLTGVVPRGRFKALNVLVPGCPGGFARCVDRCLEFTPADRPQADQIVQSHVDVSWGSGNLVSTATNRFVMWLRSFVSRSGRPPSDVTSITWETCSFGLIGLLLGHLLGVGLGSFAMACGFSASLAVGIHHFLLAGGGGLAAAVGLWREQSISILKSLATGRALINVITTAERYRDPKQKAAGTLQLIEAAASLDQMPLDDLRRLLASADEAIGDLERASFGGQSLPPVHRELLVANHRVLGAAGEKAVADRQYGVARVLYARLTKLNPNDGVIASRATQLTTLFERHTARIEKLLGEGRLEDAAKRLQNLAKHFPQDDAIQNLRTRYEERHRLLNEARGESLTQLVRDNRWHHIGEIIDGLSSLSLPLGGYARVIEECEKRRDLFERERAAAEVALKRLGPRRSTPWLARLRTVMADHPFVQECDRTFAAVAASQNRMREEVDTQVANRRWIAADNTIRAFVLHYGVGSVSLLDVAERMAGQVQAEWTRWRLLLWFFLAGLGFIAFATLFSTASWNEASLAWQQKLPIQPQWQKVIGPGFIEGLQLLASGVFLSVMLTIVVRHSVAFVPIFVSLAIAVAIASALPPAWETLRARSSFTFPQFVQVIIDAAPVMVATVARLVLFTTAAACVANAPSWAPTPLTAALAMASIYGLQSSQEWARFLPEGFAVAAVLGIVGVIGSARAWFLISLAGVVASILATTSPSGNQHDFLHRVGPPAFALLVMGVFVLGKRRVADYVWLLVAVVWACVICGFVRGLNSGDIVMRSVTLWAIACGGVAIASQRKLGTRLSPIDVGRAYLLKMRCRSTSLRGRLLTETDWYKDNRVWHAAHANRDGAGSSFHTLDANQQRSASARPRE